MEGALRQHREVGDVGLRELLDHRPLKVDWRSPVELGIVAQPTSRCLRGCGRHGAVLQLQLRRLLGLAGRQEPHEAEQL
eukprot:12765036-Alexandrium_andersonii.AAC.1